MSANRQKTLRQLDGLSSSVALNHTKMHSTFPPPLYRYSEPFIERTPEGRSGRLPGVTVCLRRLEFLRPCAPLIHRWDSLTDAIDVLKAVSETKPVDYDPELPQRIRHASLLRECLMTELKDTIEAFTDLKNQGVITYEYLWTLFQPGAFVYSKCQGQDCVFQLSTSNYALDQEGNKVLWITCTYVDYDGKRFGTKPKNLLVPEFEGTKLISTLKAVPFEFHAAKASMRARLIERGEKTEELSGFHYRYYEGVSWSHRNSGDMENRTFGGGFAQDNHTVFADDAAFRLDGLRVDENDDDQSRIKLTENQKLICWPWVRGYALKEKQWMNFTVDGVQHINISDRAFDSLVLPEKHKELLLGFAEMQQSYRTHFDDVIEAKGQGIIVLLYGPPGVGKTLTAESVAEKMKVPLYRITAEDLGPIPGLVESRLGTIFEMCTRWNAIVLLDEADIFLEQRSLHEMERNKMVSIFLRLLEYFQGIMFLTTNRVTTLDTAFQSRFHMSLDYPELDFSSRRTVWDNLLRHHDAAQRVVRDDVAEAKRSHEPRTHPHALSFGDIDKIAHLKLNGREIKNVLRMAQSLASKRGEALHDEHVQTIMEFTQHLHSAASESQKIQKTLYS